MPTRKTGRPRPAPMTDEQKVGKAKAELEKLNSKIKSDNLGQPEALGPHRSRRPVNYRSRAGNRADQLRDFQGPGFETKQKRGVTKRTPSGKSEVELAAERLKKMID